MFERVLSPPQVVVWQYNLVTQFIHKVVNIRKIKTMIGVNSQLIKWLFRDVHWAEKILKVKKDGWFWKNLSETVKLCT